ncbi:sulfurtransferase [Pseudomonas putida JB]|uniref:PQQ-dependent catabolism-associated CXXCW motif protein n=1 Tax=Pseudomonas TaxID=286 RepID=UPI0008791216|nr:MULTISPECIES: PQQ-dependent catabolism-associated CXXCW motif protein [Pseudomonas]AOX08983.1 sulfurtransferase [Pseudomonas putida JB]MCI1022796.1 PQQ-dependent catabolism-associated CXXCW motif protein [Pseudomonas putida]MDN4512271.1 PQQ-dependent catabolism-associated CXXCW motif protein [Pseudomonas sp. 2,4-D]PWY46758.1 PQQ-dependent catabolism-associated CXXCW motif protein [Pseudomonas sp. RW405]
MPRALPRLPRPLMAVLSLSLTLGIAQADTAPLFSADGYRTTHYRSPTPQQVEGGQVVDTATLQGLLGQTPRPVLIDVYRRQWLQGRFIEDEPHSNLPGSLWLANTGDGELNPAWQDYFVRNLQKATAGHPDQPLVFYCRSDCWLSWNAVKRAKALGYNNLYWYRDGLDAWQQANLPLQPAQPVPFP